MNVKTPTFINSSFFVFRSEDEEESSTVSSATSEEEEEQQGLRESAFEKLASVVSKEESIIINQQFEEDLSFRKVNMAVRQYQTDEGLPWNFPAVRKFVTKVSKDLTVNYEHTSAFGVESFRTLATNLLLGKFSSGKLESRAFGIQAISGVNALRLGAEFLCRYLHYDTVFCSAQSVHYQDIFLHAGFKHTYEYRYWDYQCCSLDFESMLEDLVSAPDGSVVVLQVSCHNPTGADLSIDDWRRVAAVVKEHHLFPFFHCAAQGMATGDVDRDAWPVRFFTEERIEFLCAQEFMELFGVYNERVGNLVVCVNEAEYACAVKAVFQAIIKSMYFSPPQFGARIVASILGDAYNFSEWKHCLKKLCERLQKIRENFRRRLEYLHTPGCWKHITEQRGMFCMTGLTRNQVEYLHVQYSIYMTEDGSINVSTINESNIGYIVAAFNDAVVRFPVDTLDAPPLGAALPEDGPATRDQLSDLPH